MMEHRYLGMTRLPESQERALLKLTTNQLLHLYNTKRSGGRAILAVGDHYGAVQLVAKAGLAQFASGQLPEQTNMSSVEANEPVRPAPPKESTKKRAPRPMGADLAVRFTPGGESKPQASSLRGKIFKVIQERQKITKAELDEIFKCDTHQYLAKLAEKKHINWVV